MAATWPGCRAPQTVDWSVAPDETVPVDRVAVLGAVILAGGCGGTVEVYRWQRRRSGDDATPTRPPRLPDGRYGFVGLAGDAECRWIAQGCREVDWPAGEPIRVIATALPTPRPACPGAECRDGACEASGRDAGRPPDLDAERPRDAGGDPGCGDCAGCDRCVDGRCVPPAGARTISLGSGHLCVVRDDGRVLCAGDNAAGQLGRCPATMLACDDPTRLAPVPGLDRAVDVSAGRAHTCAVREGGETYCWGRNGIGETGAGGGPPGGMTSTLEAAPVRVPDVALASVLAGSQETFGLGIDGRGWFWGGPLHIGRAWTPAPLVGVGAAEDGYSDVGGHCAIQRGELVCWGGSGPEVLERGMARVADGSSLALGCAISEAGRLRCWGTFAQSPYGDCATFVDDGASTIEVESASDWQSIVVGGTHACGIRGADGRGRLYCFGCNFFGQLASTSFTRPLPTRVGADEDWVHVSLGPGRTCGARADGSAWCWGVLPAGVAGALDPGRESSTTAVPSRVCVP